MRAEISVGALAARVLPFLLAFFVYAGVGAVMRPGPTGDEPHYLIVAGSIVHDGDVDLTNDYASRERVLAAWISFPLEPHAADYRGDGELRTATGCPCCSRPRSRSAAATRRGWSCCCSPRSWPTSSSGCSAISTPAGPSGGGSPGPRCASACRSCSSRRGSTPRFPRRLSLSRSCGSRCARLRLAGAPRRRTRRRLPPVAACPVSPRGVRGDARPRVRRLSHRGAAPGRGRRARSRPGAGPRAPRRRASVLSLAALALAFQRWYGNPLPNAAYEYFPGGDVGGGGPAFLYHYPVGSLPRRRRLDPVRAGRVARARRARVGRLAVALGRRGGARCGRPIRGARRPERTAGRLPVSRPDSPRRDRSRGRSTRPLPGARPGGPRRVRPALRALPCDHGCRRSRPHERLRGERRPRRCPSPDRPRSRGRLPEPAASRCAPAPRLPDWPRSLLWVAGTVLAGGYFVQVAARRPR